MKFLKTAVKGIFPFIKGRSCRRECVYAGFLMFWPFLLSSATAALGKPRLTIILIIIFSIFAIISGFSAACKRLHDLGRPAWHMLVILIPVAGIFILADMLLFKKGEDNENKYGKSHNNDYKDEGIIGIMLGSAATVLLVVVSFLSIAVAMPDSRMENQKNLSDIMNKRVIDSFEERFRNDERDTIPEEDMENFGN